MAKKMRENVIALRSEEVQDIISRMPPWIVRWGITLIFMIFFVLLGLSWLVKYPDVLKAQVIITTDPPPHNYVARASGHIKILKKENDWIRGGDLLAFIETNVTVPDLLSLDRRLNAKSFDKNSPISAAYHLGDLQRFLSDFVSAQQELRIFYQNDLEARQIFQLEKQIRSYYELKLNLESQVNLMKKELALSKEKFASDSVLYIQQVNIFYCCDCCF